MEVMEDRVRPWDIISMVLYKSMLPVMQVQYMDKCHWELNNGLLGFWSMVKAQQYQLRKASQNRVKSYEEY